MKTPDSLAAQARAMAEKIADEKFAGRVSNVTGGEAYAVLHECADALERQAVPTREFLMEVVGLTDRPDLQLQASTMLAASPPAPAPAQPERVTKEMWRQLAHDALTLASVSVAPSAPAQSEVAEPPVRGREMGAVKEAGRIVKAQFQAVRDMCATPPQPSPVASKPTLYQVMAVAKAILRTEPNPDTPSWDELRQHEINVLRARAETILAALAALAAPPQPSPVADEREAFEAWWDRHGQFSRAGGGDYEKTFAHNAWKARAALASQPTAQVEPLTDEQIERMWCESTIESPSHENCYRRGVKDAEAAHNIGRKA